MLPLFVKSWKFQESKPKNWFSGSFLEVFQLHLLLRSMSYALIFWQMKGLIKIHNRGKFYEYRVLDCQVINFQSFSYRFSIHEMPLFGELILPDSAEIFTTGSIQGNKSSASRIFEKLKFLQKREIYRVCIFGTTLTPFFPSEEDGQILKK